MAYLEEMGFPTVRCQKALLATGNADAESAAEWLFAHMEDPGESFSTLLLNRDNNIYHDSSKILTNQSNLDLLKPEVPQLLQNLPLSKSACYVRWVSQPVK
jgi:hypothetical protein